MFYLLVNDRKDVVYEKQYENLNKNQQTFITAFDIYYTLVNLIYGDKYNSQKDINENIVGKKGISLFNEINQKVRSPKIYDPMEKYVCV